MTGTRITICIICGIIGLATWTMASAKQPATKTGKSELRVGAFDSRALAIAYYRSEAFERYLAQEGAGTQETEAQRIYRRAYEAAMADSVISPDELQMLKSLQQTLGLHEDVIDEAVGETLRPLPPGPQQSGRWTLVAQNMGWGAVLYGGGIPFVLDVKDEKWYVGGVMLSLGTSFYLTWKYTENMDLPEARSQMQRYGGLVGLQYGRALNSMLGYWDNDSPDRGEVAVLMGAVPGGVYLGDWLYRRWRPSTGMAYALSLYAGLGSSIMRTLHQQIAPEPDSSDYGTYMGDNGNGWHEFDEEAYDAEDLKWRKQRLMFDIAGYPLGTWLGHKLYGRRQYTFGDAMMLVVGRATGSMYGAIVSDIFGLKLDEHDMAISWMVTAGGLGGVWAADRFIGGEDYSFGQTAMVTLGGVAGAAFATGVVVIGDVKEREFYEIAGIVGSLGGFYLIRRIITPRPEQASARSPGRQPHVNLALLPAMVGGAVLPTLAIEARW